MKLLGKDSYEIVFEPLKAVTINNLFARSVVEKHVSGSVYVDNENNPKTFHVVHPYGMSLLFGDCSNKAFNDAFRDYALNTNRVRNKHEWMQAFPAAWDSVLRDLFAESMITLAGNTAHAGQGVIELNTRINFKFNKDAYLAGGRKRSGGDIQVVRTDKKLYAEMPGSVVPKYFWNSADDFYDNGIGFSLLYQGKLAATAYASFIHDDKLELGIETVEEFRGKGLGQNACCALIDHCLEHGFEPVWACRLENTGSYKLALKLGFEPVARIPYYRLCN